MTSSKMKVVILSLVTLERLLVTCGLRLPCGLLKGRR